MLLSIRTKLPMLVNTGITWKGRGLQDQSLTGKYHWMQMQKFFVVCYLCASLLACIWQCVHSFPGSWLIGSRSICKLAVTGLCFCDAQNQGLPFESHIFTLFPSSEENRQDIFILLKLGQILVCTVQLRQAMGRTSKQIFEWRHLRRNKSLPPSTSSAATDSLLHVVNCSVASTFTTHTSAAAVTVSTDWRTRRWKLGSLSESKKIWHRVILLLSSASLSPSELLILWLIFLVCCCWSWSLNDESYRQNIHLSCLTAILWCSKWVVSK